MFIATAFVSSLIIYTFTIIRLFVEVTALKNRVKAGEKRVRFIEDSITPPNDRTVNERFTRYYDMIMGIATLMGLKITQERIPAQPPQPSRRQMVVSRVIEPAPTPKPRKRK